MIAGVDYGSKLSGNTALAFFDASNAKVLTCPAKKDADQWLMDQFHQLQIKKVFIDAPLSLPGVYTGNGENYHYRKADIELKAMSPMFLGGLTARAMQLKSYAEKSKILLIETYPAATLQRLKNVHLYQKKGVPDVLLWEEISQLLEASIHAEQKRGHEFDACLALYAGHLYENGKANVAGDEVEGMIVY